MPCESSRRHFQARQRQSDRDLAAQALAGIIPPILPTEDSTSARCAITRTDGREEVQCEDAGIGGSLMEALGTGAVNAFEDVPLLDDLIEGFVGWVADAFGSNTRSRIQARASTWRYTLLRMLGAQTAAIVVPHLRRIGYGPLVDYLSDVRRLRAARDLWGRGVIYPDPLDHYSAEGERVARIMLGVHGLPDDDDPETVRQWTAITEWWLEDYAEARCLALAYLSGSGVSSRVLVDVAQPPSNDALALAQRLGLGERTFPGRWFEALRQYGFARLTNGLGLSVGDGVARIESEYRVELEWLRARNLIGPPRGVVLADGTRLAGDDLIRIAGIIPPGYIAGDIKWTGAGAPIAPRRGPGGISGSGAGAVVVGGGLLALAYAVTR